jgi:hypothetical protein
VSVEKSKASLVEKCLVAVILDIAQTVNPDKRSRKQEAFESSLAICQLKPVNNLYTRLVNNANGWEWACFMLRTMNHSVWRANDHVWLGLLIEQSDAEVFSHRPRADRTFGTHHRNHECQMALINALHTLATPLHPDGEAIGGHSPKGSPICLSCQLGAEIGTAVGDCIAVLARCSPSAPG